MGSSSSLHSEACNTFGASDGVIHSRISLEEASLRASSNNSHSRSSHAYIQEKRREVVRARRTEVIASRSELLSLHCPRHPLLLALLPACAVSQVIMRQDCSAYAAEPLRTAGLLEAAHQYSLQDVCGSARTPSPLHSLLRRDSLRT